MLTAEEGELDIPTAAVRWALVNPHVYTQLMASDFHCPLVYGV